MLQDGLLDAYPSAAAAYSLRKLRSFYSGSAIRVRRSSDNAESDIGFTGAGDLDEAALTTFVGANDGFVTTFYDQSGNGRDLVQATAGDQPRIVNAGTVETTASGKPTILYTASPRTVMPLSTAAYGAREFFGVSQMASTDTTSVLIGNGIDNTEFAGIAQQGSATSLISTYLPNSSANIRVDNTNLATVTRGDLWTALFDDTVHHWSFDDSVTETITHTPFGTPVTTLYVDDGRLCEFVTWDVDQSANRTDIYNNQIGYWNP
jgi:hypothetical protein